MAGSACRLGSRSTARREEKGLGAGAYFYQHPNPFLKKMGGVVFRLRRPTGGTSRSPRDGKRPDRCCETPLALRRSPGPLSRRWGRIGLHVYSVGGVQKNTPHRKKIYPVESEGRLRAYMTALSSSVRFRTLTGGSAGGTRWIRGRPSPSPRGESRRRCLRASGASG